MTIRRVGALRGWRWIQEGFRLFLRNPLLWIVMCLVLMGVMYVVGHIPVLGRPLIYLLSPIPIAGMMAACRDQEQGHDLSINHLLTGFRDGAGDLVTLGGLFLVAEILIGSVVANLAGADWQELVNASTALNPKPVSPEVAGRVISAMTVGAMLIVPVALLLWYAPTLVVLDGLSVRQAMTMSLQACLRNMLPTLVYSAAMSALFLLVILTLGFGVFLWLPLAITSTYRGYRDIFDAPAPAAQAQ